MVQWTKICCAIDFSEASRIAMQIAANVAKGFGAELSLVHVVAALPAAVHRASSAHAMKIATQEAAEELGKWRDEAQALTDKPVKARVLTGDPVSEIVDLVRRERLDLVVVAPHRRTAIARVLLGSVAERIVREAPCPVLVAREADLERQEVAEEAAPYSSR